MPRQTQKKASHQQCRSGISTSPTPCCESLRQQHPNNSKQHGALAKIGNLLFCSRLGWKPSISNRVPRDPSVPLHLQKRCCLLKLRQFWQKRSLQQSHFRGRRHIGFLDSKRSSPVALKACFKQNPALIHLRHAKSFVFRAARKVPHCQKWDCHASRRWSVWQPCFWGCDMTLGRSQLFQKFTRNNDTTKGRKDDTNIHVLNRGGPPLGVQILYTFPTPKMGMKQIEQFNDIILRILRFLSESSGVTKLELFQRFPHCESGFSRCTDSARLRQDSATGGIKTGTKLW